MRQLIAGNWKMNGLTAPAASLAEAIREGADRPDCELLVWPLVRRGAQRRMVASSNIRVSSGELAVRAAVDGLGVACVNEFNAEPHLRSGALVRLLESWSPSIDGYFVAYPSRRYMLSPLRALIDMLRAARRSGRRPAPEREPGSGADSVSGTPEPPHR